MPLTFTSGTFPTSGIIQASDISSRLTDIQNKFNAAIVNADISTSAAISVDKLDANYEHLVIPITVATISGGGGWPASGTICGLSGLPDDTKGNWVATYANWACTDTGDGLGTFRVQWGYFNGATWTSVANVGNTTTMANAAGANDANDGDIAGISSVTLTAGTAKFLAVVSQNASATTMTAAASVMTATVICRRKIANG